MTQEVQPKPVNQSKSQQLIVPRKNRHTAALSGLIDSVLHKLKTHSERGLGCLSVGVVSNRKRVGVSTVTHRLALQAAMNGEGNVLIVDVNGARPVQHRLCGVSPGPGLVDHLTAEVELDKCIQESAVPHLDVLVWGSKASSGFTATPVELKELFADLRSRYRYIFIDLPWMDENSGAASLPYAVMSDGAVIVLDGASSRETPTLELVELLEENGVKVIGAIMNRYAPSLPRWIRRWF
jgi:Mrp family chromosome partitioning ATPase